MFSTTARRSCAAGWGIYYGRIINSAVFNGRTVTGAPGVVIQPEFHSRGRTGLPESFHAASRREAQLRGRVSSTSIRISTLLNTPGEISLSSERSPRVCLYPPRIFTATEATCRSSLMRTCRNPIAADVWHSESRRPGLRLPARSKSRSSLEEQQQGRTRLSIASWFRRAPFGPGTMRWCFR